VRVGVVRVIETVSVDGRSTAGADAGRERLLLLVLLLGGAAGSAHV